MIKNAVRSKITGKLILATNYKFVFLESKMTFNCISSLQYLTYILFGRGALDVQRVVFLLFPPSEHRAQCYALLDKYAHLKSSGTPTGVEQQQRLLALKQAAIGHSGFVSLRISLSLLLLAWVSFFECIPRSFARSRIAFHAPDRVHIEKKVLSAREEKGNECVRKNHKVEQSKQAP
jgi:hypothetical protein